MEPLFIVTKTNGVVGGEGGLKENPHQKFVHFVRDVLILHPPRLCLFSEYCNVF